MTDAKDREPTSVQRVLSAALLAVNPGHPRGPVPTLEEVALFAEGRMPPERREEVLSHMANSPALFDSWLALAESLQDEEQVVSCQDPADRTTTHKYRWAALSTLRSTGRWALPHLALKVSAGVAAVVVLAVALSIGLQEHRNPTAELDAAIAELMTLEPALAAADSVFDYIEVRGVTRGSEAPRPSKLDPRRRSFKQGAALGVSTVFSDSGMTDARELLSMVDAVPCPDLPRECDEYRKLGELTGRFTALVALTCKISPSSEMTVSLWETIASVAKSLSGEIAMGRRLEPEFTRFVEWSAQVAKSDGPASDICKEARATLSTLVVDAS